MAVDLHTQELLLPSQFFADEEEDILKPSDLCNEKGYNKTWDDAFHWPESSLGSSVESELGSTETKSDEDDDCIAELSRLMPQYMLQNDDNHALPSFGSEKMEKIWGSPQSTLWSPPRTNHGSADGLSQESSPPHTPVFGKDPFWDTSYDVSGKLDKMNLNDYEGPKFKHGQGLLSTPSKPYARFNSHQAVTDDQIRAIEYYSQKQEQVVNQQSLSNWGRQSKVSQQSKRKEQPQQFLKKARGCGWSGTRARTNPNPWPQTPTQVQQDGSGMRVFFLGGRSDSGNGPCGTGVFLPRGIWYSSETRKKPGCGTAFIPARVVQALQVHFDQMGERSRPNPCEAMMGNKKNGLNSKQKRQSRAVPARSNHETGLPQDWTY